MVHPENHVLNRMTFGVDLIQIRSMFERQLTVNSVFNKLLRPFELWNIIIKRTISVSHSCWHDSSSPQCGGVESFDDRRYNVTIRMGIDHLVGRQRVDQAVQWMYHAGLVCRNTTRLVTACIIDIPHHHHDVAIHHRRCDNTPRIVALHRTGHQRISQGVWWMDDAGLVWSHRSVTQCVLVDMIRHHHNETEQYQWLTVDKPTQSGLVLLIWSDVNGLIRVNNGCIMLVVLGDTILLSQWSHPVFIECCLGKSLISGSCFTMWIAYALIFDLNKGLCRTIMQSTFIAQPPNNRAIIIDWWHNMLVVLL